MQSERRLVRVVSAEIVRDGRYLITQRMAKAVLPLLWEFPGGRVRDDETDENALVRSLTSRLGITVTPVEQVLEVQHDYDEYSVVLSVYRCNLGEQEPWAERVNALAWVAPDELAAYPFPGADQKTVDLLLSAD